jgi:tetratricopeptide (TPR) repeat protein
MNPILRSLVMGAVLLFAVAFAAKASVADEPLAAFEAANRLYEQGRFSEAAEAYAELLQRGSVSAALHYNLGNAWFKAGELGRAITAYRAAARLTPRDPDVRANLQFARNRVEGPTVRTRAWENWLATLSVKEWTWLAVVGLWVTFGLLALRHLRPALAPSLRGWTNLGVLLTLGAGIGLALALYLQTRPTAIVLASKTTIHNGPFEESPAAFTASNGAELRVLDRKNDWWQVTDGARHTGWVPAGKVQVTPPN